MCLHVSCIVMYGAIGYTNLCNCHALDSHTVWRVIFGGANFRGKSEKALRINFRDFKFRHSNRSRGVALHKRWCNRYTRSISLAIFFVARPYLQRLGQIAWDRKILVLKTPSAGWQWLLLLANTGKCWPRCHDVLGHAHHDHGLA